MNDFFENGIIPEIDDKIINYLNLIGESGLSSIYMRNLYFCRNRREQDKAVAIFFNNYGKHLFADLPEDIKNYVLAKNL